MKWSQAKPYTRNIWGMEYKVSKHGEGIDWELVQSKYSDILKRTLENYPDTLEASRELTKDYSHKKEEITKPVVTTKLKAVWFDKL